MNNSRWLSSTRFLRGPNDPPGSGGSSPASSQGTPPSAPSSSSGPTSTVAPGVPAPPSASPQAPAAAQPGATAQPASDEAFDFGSVFEPPPEAEPKFPGSDAADPAVTPPATAPAQVAPAAPPAATPPAAQPSAQQPAVAQPGLGDGGQAQQPGATPPPTDQSPASDPYDPTALANALMQHEAASVEHIASTLFALTSEEAQALETDTIATVPKLLAKAFVKSQLNALMILGNIVPEMVRRASRQMVTHTENRNQFFKAWPQLDPAAHGELVNKFGVTYRMLNPQAPKEQMIAELGPLVMMAAKIPLSPQAAPGAPQQVPQANGHRPPQPAPFVPAVPGPAATSPQIQLEPWEAMFQPRD